MSRPPFVLLMPEVRNTATVFASPHSGRSYPWSFIRSSQLDEQSIRSSEDAFVEQLFAAAPDFGAPLLSTDIPRAYVDLNRAADELDPALISGARQTGHNPRISSGLGVIPRVVANGREIRTGKMTMVEAHQRLDRYYFPYHDKLADLLNQSHSMFGFAVLLDCHSMPHEALAVTSYAYDKKPEIVLGDRFGAACLPDLIEAVDEIFTAAGLRVSRNLPFAGAHVTQKYGRPSRGQHALQIEIDRSIYMDEAAMRPNDDFAEICAMLRNVVAELTELGRGALQHAAE